MCVSSEVKKYKFIKFSFPKCLEAPNYEFIPTDIKISHKIETVGSSVYCKPRPFSPAKYKIAKEQSDRLLDL